jgi:hypothetical protein
MSKPALEIVFNRLPELRGQLRTRASQAVRKTVEDIQADAAERSRVDLGNMKAGWQMEMQDDLNGDVYNEVEYVEHHEYGTVHMSAQPMATPAAEAARPGFIAAMESLLE